MKTQDRSQVLSKPLDQLTLEELIFGRDTIKTLVEMGELNNAPKANRRKVRMNLEKEFKEFKELLQSMSKEQIRALLDEARRIEKTGRDEQCRKGAQMVKGRYTGERMARGQLNIPTLPVESGIYTERRNRL